MIPFNKPYLHGRELVYLAQAAASGKISGDGEFTNRCHRFFQSRYGFSKVLLTTSCTDALELAALLLNIKPGDEIIVPSFTFVSTANAFVLRGAQIKFADSGTQNPNIDSSKIEELISARTRAIVVVHYAGIACDMDRITEIAARYQIPVVEDAAQAVDSYYKNRPLGGLGTFGTFSFHETKNVISGEGGMIAINDESYSSRAEILREKGTNRSAFFRGEVDKYGWVDIGSSFLPSEITAAYLFAQLEILEVIQRRRVQIWSQYNAAFSENLIATGVQLPLIPDWATNNAHMYYLVVKNIEERDALIHWLRCRDVHAVFHYISLHSSRYFSSHHDGRTLATADRYSNCLVRLPLYFELTDPQVEKVINAVVEFFRR